MRAAVNELRAAMKELYAEDGDVGQTSKLSPQPGEHS